MNRQVFCKAFLTLLAFAGLDHSDCLAQWECRGQVQLEQPGQGALRLFTVPFRSPENGRFQSPSKPQIFQAATDDGGLLADANGHFVVTVEEQNVALFGYQDKNGNGQWDPQAFESFGWFSEEAAGRPARLTDKSTGKISFTLKAARAPLTKQLEEGGAVRVPHGSLRLVNGYPVLSVSGDAQQRGLAHGQLLAEAIIDFFRFYILEDKFGSAKNYEEGFAKFLHSHFNYPPEYVTECEAVIQGMKRSGISLFVSELGRDFSVTDLYAINGYIETRAMRSSCTQFAAWGQRTETTDVAGGMITGRNMDGEVDIRKVTVSHFLLTAVEPELPGQKRFVSMMWPGFVATISGMNEDGFYTMENAGLTGPGPVVSGLVPFSWTMREALAKLGADATASDVQQLVDSFDNQAGGSCGPGCITLFATPYHGQDQPAFILEGDRFGDAQRFAEQVEPRVPQALAASNHPLLYGVDESRPGKVFDKTPSFSSLWRYEAGSRKLEAWWRAQRKIGTAEMRDLLQTVAHGTTEYSIITRPNQREFDVAVASMKAEPWDAPYRQWTTFQMEEVFEQEDQQPAATDAVTTRQ